jgi:Class II Aldolase and Adducin N-terminal domain
MPQLNESKLREEICRLGDSLFTRGLTFGSAGNISARLEDGWLMTPTNFSLGRPPAWQAAANRTARKTKISTRQPKRDAKT